MTGLEQVINDLNREIERDNQRMEEIAKELERKERENEEKRKQFETESERREKEISALNSKLTEIRNRVAGNSEKIDKKRVELQKANDLAAKKV